MNKLFATFLLMAMAASQAHADFKCFNEEGDSLKILHSELIPYPHNTRNSILAAEVVLNSNGNTEIYKGKFIENWNSYQLYDPKNGNNISLQVVKPISHGGRCGRCSPDPLPDLDVNHYAKLSINQTEIDFTCILVK